MLNKIKRASIVWVVTLVLWGCSDAEGIKNLDAKVRSLYDAKKYSEAVRVAEEAVEFGERAFGKDSVELINPLSNLAGLYRIAGRLPEAKQVYVRVLAMHDQQDPPDEGAKVRVLHDIATIEMQQSNFEEAERYEKQVLEIREKTLDPEAVLIASALNNLGYVYLMSGRNSDAEPLLLRAANMLVAAVGEDHPHTDVTYMHLAQLYRQFSRFDDAENVLLKLVEMRRRRLGEDDPELARAYNNLAIACREQGQSDKAVDYFEKSLIIFDKNPDVFKDDIRLVLQNYVEALDQMGRKDDVVAARKRLTQL